MPEWLRGRSAKPLFISSNLVPHSNNKRLPFSLLDEKKPFLCVIENCRKPVLYFSKYFYNLITTYILLVTKKGDGFL